MLASARSVLRQRKIQRANTVRPYGHRKASLVQREVPRRGGGIGACMGALGCTRKVTIPQSALSRSQLPLHKGAFNPTPIEFLLAPEGPDGEK